jgi:serine/threonine protein kinase
MAWRYQPIATLGRGGMADVYLAIARGPVGFNKLVVLKHLRSSDDDSRSRDMFLDEARLAARLNHPNIVDTYDVGQDGDGESYFIAMEYLEGQSLSRLLKAVRGKGVDATAWIRIASDALHGLHYAHELRDYDGRSLEIVHRDVSPANIFVTYDGEVKVLDFGIAKATLNLAHTDAGVFKGKLGYMAREQALGEDVDRRADIFSMGVVLWEALTERRLLAGGISMVLEKLGSSELPTVASVRPDIDPRVSAIVERALKREPLERYGTAAEMREQLEEYLRSLPRALAKAEVGALVSSMFEAHRTAVQRGIERHLASVDATGSDGDLRMPGSLIARAEGASEPSLPPSLSGGDIFWHAVAPAPSVEGSGTQRTRETLRVPPSASASAPAPLPRTPVEVRTAPSAKARGVWAIAGVGVIAIGTLIIVLRQQSAAPIAAPTRTPAPPEAIASSASVVVSLDSVPRGADVSWNGLSLGRTPITAPIPPGMQTFLFSKDGYAIEPLVAQVTDAANPVARTVTLRQRVDPASIAHADKRPPLPVNHPRPRLRLSRQEPAPESSTAPSAGGAAPSPTAEPPQAAAAAVASHAFAPAAAPPSAPEAPEVPGRVDLPPGTVEPKAVTATVRAHADQVRTCLDRARMEHPDLQGRLSVRATVDPTGHVISAAVTKGIPGGARLDTCVLSAFESWTFPAPAGGVNGIVVYSFVFE